MLFGEKLAFSWIKLLLVDDSCGNFWLVLQVCIVCSQRLTDLLLCKEMGHTWNYKFLLKHVGIKKKSAPRDLYLFKAFWI